MARFKRVGHRITGDRRQGASRVVGYEKMHADIVDATRLAFVVVLSDEQRATTVGFLALPLGWFSEQGITCQCGLSDNGSAYRSAAWRKACRTLDSGRSGPSFHVLQQRQSGALHPDLCRELAPMECHPRLPRNRSPGSLKIWSSKTNAGATWPLVASVPSIA